MNETARPRDASLLVSRLRDHAKAATMQVVDVRSEGNLSYAELWARSGAYAEFLVEHGVAPGDRVAVSMSTTLHTMIAVAAVLRVGGVLVPLVQKSRRHHTDHDQARIITALRVAEARVVLASGDDAPLLRTLAGQLADPPRTVIHEEGLAAGSGDPALPRVDLHDPAVLQFTAGTTSASRAVELSHANLAHNIGGVLTRIHAESADRLYSWLPLYHDMGLIGGLFATWYAGASARFASPMDFVSRPLGWIDALSQWRATVTLGPQFAYRLCLARAEMGSRPAADCDLGLLRLALNGAEAIDERVCREFERHFAQYGLRQNVIQPCYGLAENCVAVTLRSPEAPRMVRHFQRAALSSNRIELHPEAGPDTATLVGNGTPIGGTEVRIAVAASEDIGEIMIAGASAASRLSDGEGSPLSPITGRWIATGDLGALVDGELFILGRVKEAFKIGGRTFVPSEVEDAAVPPGTRALGNIAAFAGHGLPSERDTLVLVVEYAGSRGAPPPDELIADMRRRLLQRMRVVPDDIVIVRPGAIPLTSSGKIRRLTLREQYAGNELEIICRG